MEYQKKIKLDMQRPAAVKYFYDIIKNQVRKGWKEFIIQVADTQTYSNICAPMAGILDYYRAQGINFEVRYEGIGVSYAEHTRFENPVLAEDTADPLALEYPFDKVWRFRTSEGVNALVSAFCLAVRKADIINEGVITGVEWCLNESMDNVLQHSGIGYGYVMAQLHKNSKQFSVCVFDAGMGIFNSLRFSKYHPKTSLDAITLALQEKVTRDEKIGQGNGLWGLSNIVRDGQGSMQIKSNGSAYILDRDGKSKTFAEGFIRFDAKLGTTLIDFQLNYGNKVDIVSALHGHTPTDYWLENLENETGEIVIKVAEIAGGTGTRLSAEKLRNLIVNIAIADNKKVILDFQGVNLISSSFADELIGKIISNYGIIFFMRRFSIENLTKINNSVLNRSVQQRMAQTYYDEQLEQMFEEA